MFRQLRLLALTGAGVLLAAVQALASETGVPIYIQAKAQINTGYAGGGIGFNVNAQNAQGTVINIGSGGGGGGPGASVVTNVMVARLQPGQTTTVLLSGSNLANYTVQFLGGSGAAIESRVASGSPGDYLPQMRYSANGNGSGGVNVSYQIRLLDGGQVQRAALGAAVPLANESVLWRVSLGANKEGTSAGWLSLMSQGWQSDWSGLYTPTALVAPDNVTGTKYWTNGSNLWQAISEEGFVQIEPTSSTSYTVKSYIRTNATGSAFPYGIASGAVPITTHTVQKHPAYAKGLKISTIWAGNSATERVTELKADGSTWIVEASAPDTASNIVVDERTGGTLTNVGDTATRNISVTQSGAAGTSGAVQENKQLFPWGPETTSATGAPGGAAPRTLSVAYGTANGAWARPTSISTNTGGWVNYQYYDDFDRFGQVYREFRPFQDSPSSTNTDATQGDVTTYDYVADPTGVKRLPSFRERRINNEVVGKTLWSYSWPSVSLGGGITAYLVETTQNSYANASTAITTVAKAFRGDVSIGTFGLRLGGYPYSSTSADGSKTSHAYFLQAFDWGTASDPDFKAVTIHGTTVATGADYITSYDGRTIDGLYVVPGKSTAEVSFVDKNGRLRRNQVYAYFSGSGWILCGQTDYTLNDAGQCTQVTGMNGQILSTATYLGSFLTASTDASGVETTYEYYDDGRLKRTVRQGVGTWDNNLAQNAIATKFEYNPLGQVIKTIVGDGQGETLVSEAAYDAAGRLTGSKSPGINWTTYTYGAGDQVATVTYPNGSSTTSTYYDDGRLKNVTGSATVAQYWGYWVSGGQVNAQRTLAEGGVWTNYGYDWLGRQLEQWQPTYGAPANYVYYDYNNKGQLWRVRRPALADVLMEYDSFGAEIRTGLDRNGNGVLDISGTDRISERENKIVSRSGVYWAESHEWVYDTDSSNHSIGAYSYAKLTGLSSTRLSESEVIDANGNVTSSWTDVDRAQKRVTQTSSSASSSQNAWVRIHNGLPVESQSSTGVVSRTRYDALLRHWQSMERSGGWSSTGYHGGTGLVSTQWDASNNVVAQYYYDGAGHVTQSVNALGKSTRMAYTARGEVWRTWGDVPNPVEYEYDAWGQMKYLKTYRDNGAGWTGASWPGNPGAADVTTWDYDHDSRMLKSKIDAAGRAVSYEYNQARQVTKRISPRHVDGNPGLDLIRVSYAYDNTGAATTTDYNDSTPDVSYTYLRSGLVDTVTDATGGRNFDYRSQDGQLDFEQLSSFYSNRRVTRGYETGAGVAGRYHHLALGNSSNPWADANTYYGYIDNRVTWVDNYTAGYAGRGYNIGYAANSDLLQQVWQGDAQYSHWRQYEANRNVIQFVENWEGGSLRAKFNYTRNNAGQVTAVTKTGQMYNIYGTGSGVHTRYGYTDRGELSYEGSFLANPGDPGNPSLDVGQVLGRHLGIGYDAMGNRTGQDRNGSYVGYGTNNLNQITSRGASGIVDVTGAASASEPVQVNGQSANRQGEYFHKAITSDNTGGPQYQPVRATVGSDLETAQATITSAYVPASGENFSYDDEGNMTADGRWSYKYDAENRLIEMETGSAAVAAGTTRQRLTFTYDYMGRRVRKVVQNLEVNGFLGQYFNNGNLDSRHHVRTDSQVWFGLGWSDFPGAGQDSNDFSTYWSGYLFPSATGNHRFRFTVDDMFRLWVNGQLVAKSWHGQGATPYETADVYLQANVPAHIQIEFYQGWGGADARLEWVGPSHSWQAVPAASMKSSSLDGLGSWRTVTDNKFLYDGWNLVGEYDNANGNAVIRSYTWGLDLSSTAQGAGGIGGLLKIDEGGQTYLPQYDELGHIHGLVRASDHALVATYEYNAFGEVVRQSGEYAARNPLGWATKYTDRETGLVYFGLRYYSPNLGRFINPDPLGEQGGINLQAFCKNDPVNAWDYLGMATDYYHYSDDAGETVITYDNDGTEDTHRYFSSAGDFEHFAGTYVSTRGMDGLTGMVEGWANARAEAEANYAQAVQDELDRVGSAVNRILSEGKAAVLVGIDGHALTVLLPGSSAGVEGGVGMPSFGTSITGSGTASARPGHFDPTKNVWVNPDGTTVGFKVELGETEELGWWDEDSVRRSMGLPEPRTVAGYPFAQSFRGNCGPTALRTVTAVETGRDPGEIHMNYAVAAQEGNLLMDWNRTGTELDALNNFKGYASTMTGALYANGVRADSVYSAGVDRLPRIRSMANTIMESGRPIVMAVSINRRTIHAVTVQYSRGDFLIANPIAAGGLARVPLNLFVNGEFSLKDSTNSTKLIEIRPEVPLIVPMGPNPNQ